MISYYHRQLQITYDENVITTDSLLLRPKSASDGLYELLEIGQSVVVMLHINLLIDKSFLNLQKKQTTLDSRYNSLGSS